MKRRDFIQNSLVTGLAGVLPAAFVTAEDSVNPDHVVPKADDRRALVNEPWARQVLQREGCDGIIAFNPVNVFYLSNYTSFYQRMQLPFSTFAVFPRDQKKSTLLVTSTADLWSLTNAEREHPEWVTYSQPEEWRPYLDQENWSTHPSAVPGFGSIWPQNSATFSEREQHWIEASDRAAPGIASAPIYALAKALHRCGLSKARLAIDDMQVADLLRGIGFDHSTFVPGENIFRKIRVIKSAVEIGHMRKIARVNQAATMAMIRQLERGANSRDINQLFLLEAAKRGAHMMWLVAGGVGGLRRAEVTEGEPLLIDAVSSINHYHGDFGRTVVLGEPSAKLQQRVTLIKAGWEAAFETMRPGVRYSEIKRAARKAMTRPGQATPKVGVTPHSVGLQHTDEPFRDGLPFTVRDDLELQENMTLTVDFPSMEIGWGSCHLEDLVRITTDGAEPLASMDGPLVVI